MELIFNFKNSSLFFTSQGFELATWVLRLTTFTLCLWGWLSTTIFYYPLIRFYGEKFHYAIPITYIVIILVFFVRKVKDYTFSNLFSGAVTRLVILIFLYFLATTIPTFVQNSLSLPYSLQTLFVPIFLLLFTFLLPTVFSTDDYHWLFKTLGFFLTLVSLFCLLANLYKYQTFCGIPLQILDSRGGSFARVSLYLHRNYAGHAIMGLPALLLYLYFGDSKEKTLLLFCFFIVLSHILFGFSRTTQGVAFISLLPLLGFLKKNKVGVWAISLGFLLFISWAVFISEIFSKYLGTGFQIPWRVEAWRELFGIWIREKKILFGFGYRSVHFQSHGDPHNVYLAQLVFYGLFGFTLYVFLLFHGFQKIVRNTKAHVRDPSIQFLMALVGALFIGAFFERFLTFPHYLSFMFTWMLMGFLGRKNHDAFSNST